MVRQMFRWCPECAGELAVAAILSMKEKSVLGWKCTKCKVYYDNMSLKKAIYSA